MCTAKRPNRFCRASVSHVARFFKNSLLFPAPGQVKSGRVEASEKRTTEGLCGSISAVKAQTCQTERHLQQTG